ncbi:MAG TPA: glycosyl hydrolase family 28-related protein, partial [Stellaceae bacterium]|nr:glycosyl hydrolase family 28-related protein [Stellaceae bacterium]
IPDPWFLIPVWAQAPGNFSSLTTTGPNTLGGATTAGGDLLACSGRPWYDVKCAGAVGNDIADDTAALQNAINTAVTNGWPVHIPAGTYKITSQITLDYAGQARNGFTVISEGATLDGRAIPSGPVLQVICSGGTISNPTTCFYFRQRGTLFITANEGGTNLTTLSAGAAANATTLSVAATAPFYVGGTIDIVLSDGTTQAVAVSAIGSGTITITPALRQSANNGAQISRPSYPFTLGKIDFSDQHNSFKIDHLSVNNAASAPGAGGCQFNAVYDSDIYAVCDSSGGAGGIALEQTQFSRISGAGSAAATGGEAIVLENGYNFSNVFFALDLEVAPTCLAITDPHHGDNTFVSPYMNCTTAVNATASDNNVLINPQYAGAVTNFGPQSVGISVIGTGSRPKWMFPAAASYTAAPIDDGLALSSYNAPGASLAVTLPAIATVNPGWRMDFATDNGKGMTISAPDAAKIVSGNKNLSSITLGGGNYEFVELESDGNNWRMTSSTKSTRLNMGYEAPPWPSTWLYPSTPGYAATLGDNGNILSSYNTAAGLTVTLPPTTAIPTGWAMGFATDNGKPLTITVNGTAGGHIVYPGSGASQTAITLANTSQGAYEFLVLQYDASGNGGTGNFRVLDATPATAQALGELGSASLSHWSFPATAAYSATIADNGNVISPFNSPQSYMAVTLPPGGSALPMGWTIGIASDSGKTMSVQVNATNGGHILFPGSGPSTTSFSLAAGDYEFAALRYDGSNFRITEVTPATASTIGVSGNAPGVNRWSFPPGPNYAATSTDNGNAVSSYNTAAGLTVILPSTTAIAAGWTLGLATDNGKSLTVQTNATSGGKILEPARGGVSATSMTLASGQNYEYAQVQFDGSNFRLVALTPQSLNALGGLLTPGTPASSGAACNTGELQADSNYLYFCTAPNAWKRAALSSF